MALPETTSIEVERSAVGKVLETKVVDAAVGRIKALAEEREVVKGTVARDAELLVLGRTLEVVGTELVAGSSREEEVAGVSSEVVGVVVVGRRAVVEGAAVVAAVCEVCWTVDCFFLSSRQLSSSFSILSQVASAPEPSWGPPSTLPRLHYLHPYPTLLLLLLLLRRSRSAAGEGRRCRAWSRRPVVGRGTGGSRTGAVGGGP